MHQVLLFSIPSHPIPFDSIMHNSGMTCKAQCVASLGATSNYSTTEASSVSIFHHTAQHQKT